MKPKLTAGKGEWPAFPESLILTGHQQSVFYPLHLMPASQ